MKIKNKIIETKNKATEKIITGKNAARVLLMTSFITASAQESTDASSGFDTATNAINVIKTFFIGLIGCIGIIMLVKGILEMSSAIESRQPSEFTGAILKIAGGIVTAGVSGVITALGLG